MAHLRRRALRVILCAALLGVAWSSVSPAEPSLATAATNAFPIVGHMYASDQVSTTVPPGSVDTQPTDTRWAYSQLLLDTRARRGYQVLSFEPAVPSPWQTEISVFDLDHLSLLRRVDFPGLELVTNSHEKEGFPVALRTGARPALFLIAGLNTPLGVNPGDLVIVDLTTMTISSMSVQPSVPACNDGGFPGPCPTLGLTYDERSGAVWAYVAQSEVNGVFTNPVYSFAAVAVDPTSKTVLATAPLPTACNGELQTSTSENHDDQTPLFRSADGGTLWTVCMESQSSLGYVTAPVAMPLTPQGLPKSAAPPAIYSPLYGVTDVYADPPADRLVFRQVASGDRTAAVFDGQHGAFVGDAGLGNFRFPNGIAVSPSYSGNGVDTATGRFYHISDNGVFLVDDRRTDRQGFPQATVFTPPAAGWSGARSIVVDPVTRHVFVLGCVNKASATNGATSGTACDNQYIVYQDNLPLGSDVPLTSLDSNTGNVPLVPGSTVAIYAAHGQGFGSRSYTYNPPEVLTGTGSGQPNPAGGVSDVLQAGATTVAGEGSGADLTNNGATANGITADADSQTRQQFSKTNQSFPYAQVPCDDTGGTEVKNATTADPGGSTQVDCNLTQGTASVTSADRSSDAAGGKLPSTSPTESDVSVTVSYAVCPAAPVCNGVGSGPSAISTATATVKGIDLAAAVSISYLQVTATAVAGGRSGTALTKSLTTIRGVHAGAYDCAANCDPMIALQQINSALAQELPGQVQVTFPTADATAAKGTQKGYYAAVEKDTYALLNDITVSGDSRPELVGMVEIRDNGTLYQGSKAKQITEYGGVEVESRFGITALDLSSPTFGTGAITPGTSIPGTAGTAGQFVPGSNGGGGTSSAKGPGAATGSRNNATGPLAGVINGLAWLLDWTQLPLMSLMWIVLLLPAYLATRRQRLEVLAL